MLPSVLVASPYRAVRPVNWNRSSFALHEQLPGRFSSTAAEFHCLTGRSLSLRIDGIDRSIQLRSFC
jgi:hypothetical protein